ncbi:Rab GTPase-like family protein [Giardia muris]|uniref:Rab GTPase-like family protein n=1 Tax=Giardia muris TaxID=5742 RepID=A0A4Z1SWF1_GIAMU|nr:Rab GTPase-like family protein [Giardia muris]|eukprot:TNJ30066.1 Rab GTPase-like family protein [Giardia muris]
MSTVRSTIAVLGDPHVGKTALINSVCGETTQTVPTMRPQTTLKRIRLPDSECTVDLLLTDCPSHYLALGHVKRVISECQYLLVVANCLDAESLKNVDKWVEFFRDSTMAQSVTGVLALTHAYEDASTFSLETAAEVAARYGLELTRCSVAHVKECDAPFLRLAHLVRERPLVSGEE